MPSLHILPGTVTSDSLRALLVSKGAGPAHIVLRRAGTTRELPLTLTPLSPSPAFGLPLAKRGIQLKLAVASGLEDNTRYELIARSPLGPRAVGITTLPRCLPPAGLAVAVASCYYDSFRGDLAYFNALRAARLFGTPVMKWLLGDNIYLDVAPDALGYKDGYDETVARYTRYFVDSPYTNILGHLPTCTLWDDHDLWNDYPEEVCYLSRSHGPLRERYEAAALEGIDLFQRSLDPPAIVPGGRSFTLDFAGVSVFFADLRTHRTPVGSPSPRLLPETELVALTRWAQGLRGAGVLVTGQPLWIETKAPFETNPPAYRRHYALLWRALREAPFDVLVLSGDVHHSRLLSFDLGGGRRVYELTTSPACHLPTTGSIMAGTYTTQGRDAIDFPERVEIDERLSGCRPTLAQYLFGTDLSQNFALVHFVPATDGELSIGAAFIDEKKATVAAAQNSRRRAPERNPCSGNRLFTLKRRTR